MAMDEVEQSAGLLMIGMIGLVAVFVVAVMLVGWLLWDLSQVLL
jgi:tetrahydromethanopterin S-methyltransferase subunit F